MAGYTKLSSSLVTSTVWRESSTTRCVWITMLALSDQHGEVQASLPGLADMSRVTILECEEALGVFLNPDPYSRTKTNEGRRIEPIDGGWSILNYSKHRDLFSMEHRRALGRERARRFRERSGEGRANNDDSVTVTDGNADVTQSNDKQKQKQKQKQRAEAEAYNDSTHATLAELCDRLPESARPLVAQMGRDQRNPSAWAASILAILNGMAGERTTPDALSVALTEIAATEAKPTPANVRAFLRRVKSDAARSTGEPSGNGQLGRRRTKHDDTNDAIARGVAILNARTGAVHGQ